MHTTKSHIFFRFVISLLIISFSFLTSACDFNDVLLNGDTSTVITLSQNSADIEVGKSFTLSANVSDNSPVLWVSGMESVASVTQDGVVTGISEGESVISAIAGDALATCIVTVTRRSEAVTVTLSLSSAQLKVGEYIQLDAKSSDGSPIIWSSSDESVATVDCGLVTGLSVGKTVISATTELSWAECLVTVVEFENTITISISQTSASLKTGESLKLTAISFDGNSVVWSSSDPSVASVKGGIVTAINEGTATITASTDKASASCIVTVLGTGDTFKEGYTLVWNDEFSGNSLDLSKWSYMTGVYDVYGNSTGPWYWGNNELQYYTQDAVTVSDGSLVVTATRKDMDYGRTYTSGRICTRDNGYWTYGYFEARMKTPALNGMWPAFWMLPQPSDKSSTNNIYGYWAASGEIDIMEAKGRLKNKVDCTLHYGNYGSSTNKGTTATLSSDTDQWHIYGLEWNENYIKWFIDGIEVLRISSATWWSAAAPDSATAPFDQPFYILFDLAVGGNYDGGTAPDANFTSASMYVDYVRVYKSL